MALAWAILSGIEANHTGTGRFMQHLQAVILKRSLFNGTIFYCPAGKILPADTATVLAEVPHLFIWHPQMWVVRETLALMHTRAAKNLKPELYLLDSFFFCLRSYNHLDHETAPCLRCIGPGQVAQAAVTGCRPWPAQDPA